VVEVERDTGVACIVGEGEEGCRGKGGEEGERELKGSQAGCAGGLLLRASAGHGAQPEHVNGRNNNNT
jgi:hypothetical protein